MILPVKIFYLLEFVPVRKGKSSFNVQSQVLYGLPSVQTVAFLLFYVPFILLSSV